MNAVRSTICLRNTAIATGVVVIVGLVAAPYVSRWNAEQLANRLATRVELADDTDVKVPLRQLATLGLPAIEPLVSSAASARATVAATARQIVDEQVARLTTLAAQGSNDWWTKQDALVASQLAESLATHVGKFGPAGKQWTVGVALRLVELTEQLPPKYSRKMLDDCSRVLATAPPRRRDVRTVVQNPSQLSTSPVTELPVPAPSVIPLTRASEQSLEILARIEPGHRPAEPPHTNRTEVPRVAQAPPAIKDGENLSWSRQQQSLVAAKPLLSDSTIKLEPKAPAAAPRTLSNSQVVDVPTPAEMEAYAERLREMPTQALFLKLEDASRYRAGTIRSVLKQRGFVPAEIELRLRMSAVGSGERLRLVDEVVRLPASSSTRTLRWLLTDQSGDVRLRALTALATTQAADVRQIARELATNDQDPRVAELATKLMR